MRFAFELDESLPRLAWCAALVRGSATVRVFHGAWVETRPTFFFEGAWNGRFVDGQPSGATAAFGSGGELTGDAVLFVTPTHMLERVHAIEVDDTLWVSNSLAFVLAASGEQLDERYRYYHFDLMTNMRGYRRYKPSVPTRAGRDLRVFFHANLRVDSSLAIEPLPKAVPGGFSGYSDYIAHLRQLVAEVCANAAGPGRATTSYSPLATISSGYDSPATALLAREVGCREAVTFGTARPGYEEDDDSGRAIAEVLGLAVHEFDRTAYRDYVTFPEAEFLAYGAGGEEVVFAPLEQILPGRILFTGYLGDAVWNRVTARVNTELLMLYPGGSSLGEFRLRVGFIHFPVPTAGYIRHPSVYAVTNSPEMEPWTLRNDYDWPIPRRLLEQAGVPRAAFGRTKKAITQPLWNTEDLESIMAPPSYRDFCQFIAPLSFFDGTLDTLAFRGARFLYEANLRVNWRLMGAARRLGISMTERPLVDERFSRDRGPSSFTFHWGVARTLPRYGGVRRA